MKLAALLLCLATAASAQSVTVEEPAEYRDDHYEAPVPATLRGGTVVDTATAHDLWETGGTAFIDVLPRAPKPAGLPKGTIWRDKPRDSIPGSLWLPNVGYGRLADVTAAYFRDGLDRATGGDPSRPVLFFCRADCWMSWNAAKRAIEWGYTAVSWYPDGTDGWTFMEYPTARLEPMPEPGQ